MRPDIAQNAAVAGGVPEPFRADVLVELVGRDVHGLHHAADGAGFHQFARLNRGSYFQPLGVHDGEDAAGFFNRPPHFGKLVQSDDAGLVAQIILAVAP